MFIFCIKALYFNTYSRVRVNDELTSPIVIGWGAKQGCTLSPTLFTVDINDLIDCLNQEDNGISFVECKVTCSLYADDLVILDNTPVVVQNSLNVLSKRCKGNGVHGNKSKQNKIYTF